MMKKIGVFTGTFNPFTKGHLNILQQAEKIFDEVIIAIGDNPGKEKSEIDRLATLKIQLPGKRVEKFSGFLVDYINDLKKEGDIIIVRGLRNSSDLLYEINNLRVLNDMDPSIKTVFFVCDRKYEHISSTLIRQMEKIQEGSASEYLVKPEMFDDPEFAPRISMSERYNYEKLIQKYDLEKVKNYFEKELNSGHYHNGMIEWIKKDLKKENYISLVFGHIHPVLRDNFLRKENNSAEDGYAIKQIYKAFGAPKGLTPEEFHEEAIKMLEDIKESRKKSDVFLKEYHRKHKLCPKCGSEKYNTTLVGYPLVAGEEDKYKDLNIYTCLDCGDRHTAHERVEKTNN